MSIINSFDKNRKALISPSNIYNGTKEKVKTVIMVFSENTISVLLENGLIEKIVDIRLNAISESQSLYLLKNSQEKIIIFQTLPGAPMAVGLIEELFYLYQIENVIMYRVCGILDCTIGYDTLIIPTFAYRDEGTSYHYKECSDYIEIRRAQELGDIFSKYDYAYVMGKTWTTDAFYRETKKNYEIRKLEGCICVEMECSALQAVCDYRGINFYPFLFGADNLDAKIWERRIFGNFEGENRLKYFFIALKVAKEINFR